MKFACGDPLFVFFCGLSFDIRSSLFDILRFSRVGLSFE